MVTNERSSARRGTVVHLVFHLPRSVYVAARACMRDRGVAVGYPFFSSSRVTVCVCVRAEVPRYRAREISRIVWVCERAETGTRCVLTPCCVRCGRAGPRAPMCRARADDEIQFDCDCGESPAPHSPTRILWTTSVEGTKPSKAIKP
jgi:hypothetical protein